MYLNNSLTVWCLKWTDCDNLNLQSCSLNFRITMEKLMYQWTAHFSVNAIPFVSLLFLKARLLMGRVDYSLLCPIGKKRNSKSGLFEEDWERNPAEMGYWESVWSQCIWFREANLVSNSLWCSTLCFQNHRLQKLLCGKGEADSIYNVWNGLKEVTSTFCISN